MDSFGMKYIFLNMLFLLLGTEIVLSDKQCDCESLSFLTDLVQQEIFQRKLEYMKLRSELRRLSEGHNVVKQTLAGTTPTNDVSGLEKDKSVSAIEQRFGDLEKQLKAKLESGFDKLEERTNEMFTTNKKLQSSFDLLEKRTNETFRTYAKVQSDFDELGRRTRETFRTNAKLQSGFEELEKKTNESLKASAKMQLGFDDLERRTNETLRINAERNTFFKQTITIALKKEKAERVTFISKIQSLMEDHKGAFVEFKTNAQDFIDNKIEAHVEMSQKFERNISENFKYIKNTISSNLEEHFTKTDQDLASHRLDSELFEKKISNDLNKFKAKVSGDIETAGNRTALSVTNLLNTLKNSTEYINECIADIETIRDVINDISSDTERDRNAIKELQIEFDNNVAMVDRIFNLINMKVGLERDCKDILRTIPGAKSGQYKISLGESNKDLSVYCDMETDGGGWTVFQRRINGATDFYRNYTEYENGFGEISGEFWLGLKNIQELTKQGVTEFRLDVTSVRGTEGKEIFQDFKLLGPEYTLQLGSHASNSDFKGRYGMLFNKGSGFSTYDHDADTFSNICPVDRKGAWWYNGCTYVNLNGDYSASALRAVYHWGLSGGKLLKSTSMMLRRTT